MVDHKPGWGLYRKGIITNGGKIHFYKKDRNDPMCGNNTKLINPPDYKYMTFSNSIPYNEKRKCKKCILVAETWGEKLP